MPPPVWVCKPDYGHHTHYPVCGGDAALVADCIDSWSSHLRVPLVQVEVEYSPRIEVEDVEAAAAHHSRRNCQGSESTGILGDRYLCCRKVHDPEVVR